MDNEFEIDVSEINKNLTKIKDLNVTDCIQKAIKRQTDALMNLYESFSVEIKRYQENNAFLKEKLNEIASSNKESEPNKWSVELLKNLSKPLAECLNNLYKSTDYPNAYGIFENLRAAFQKVGINMIYYKPGDIIPSEDAKMLVESERLGVTEKNEGTVCECLGVTFASASKIIVEGRVSVYNRESFYANSGGYNDNSINKNIDQSVCKRDADFIIKKGCAYPYSKKAKSLFGITNKWGDKICAPQSMIIGHQYKGNYVMTTPQQKRFDVIAYWLEFDNGELKFKFESKDGDRCYFELTYYNE